MPYRPGMAEHRPFEAAALGVGYALDDQGYHDLAAALLQVVPRQDIVTDAALRAVIDDLLLKIATTDRVEPWLRERAAHAAALPPSDPSVDPGSRDGRVGTVWISWKVWDDFDDEDARGEDRLEPGYSVSWQSNDPGYSWVEDGPYTTSLRDALTWARDRTDAVVVRPAWDQGTSYWAGPQPPTGRDHPSNLPPLDESRA
ncbi:hypothetical protein [Nocardioides ungokensis]